MSAPVPLAAEHDLSEFDCGVEVLNDWLKNRAVKNESRFSRTYVVCDGTKVAAYFCISAGAVDGAAAPGAALTGLLAAPAFAKSAKAGLQPVARVRSSRTRGNHQPGKLRRNAPDTIPISVIGRLAVSRDYAGRGLGADILSDALRRIAIASQSIGIGAVLVQAKDDRAKRFYMACAEFIEFPADSRTLFLPIETVIAAFS